MIVMYIKSHRKPTTARNTVSCVNYQTAHKTQHRLNMGLVGVYKKQRLKGKI